MTFNNLITVHKTFPPWIKLMPRRDGTKRAGATVVFPRAGAAAASYRSSRPHWPRGATPTSCSIRSAPSGAQPAPETVHELALGLFEAAPWTEVAPLGFSGTAWARSSPSSCQDRRIPRRRGGAAVGVRRSGTVRRCRHAGAAH